MILQCDNLQHTKCLYICLTTYIQLVFVLCVVRCFKIVNESYVEISTRNGYKIKLLYKTVHAITGSKSGETMFKMSCFSGLQLVS